MDRMILSMASSRRLSRDKNKAFLEKQNQNRVGATQRHLMLRTYRKRSQGSVASLTMSRRVVSRRFIGTGGWPRVSSKIFRKEMQSTMNIDPLFCLYQSRCAFRSAAFINMSVLLEIVICATNQETTINIEKSCLRTLATLYSEFNSSKLFCRHESLSGQ